MIYKIPRMETMESKEELRPHVDLAPPVNPGTAKLPPKLDLSRMAPPKDLENTRLEELTIDGICGVY